MTGSKIGAVVANDERVWIARLKSSAVATNRTGASAGSAGISAPSAGMISRPSASNPQYRRMVRRIVYPSGRALSEELQKGAPECADKLQPHCYIQVHQLH